MVYRLNLAPKTGAPQNLTAAWGPLQMLQNLWQEQTEGIRAGALFKGPERPSLLTIYENAAPALHDELPESRKL